jgi:UDP-glucose 4-epimerase
MNKIFVVGASGFIGKSFVKKNLLNGYEIIEVTRNEIIQSTYNLTTQYSRDKITSLISDSDTIVYLASATNPSSRDLLYDLNVNISSLNEWLDISKEFNNLRFIYISSGGTVYGNCLSQPILETQICRPMSPYGISKVTAENLILSYNSIYDINYIILRVSNVYGPGFRVGTNQGIIGTLINRAINSQVIEIWGDGTAVRDYIYIDDLIDAIFKACLKNDFGIFNVGSGVGTSINELIEKISNSLGLKLDLCYKNSRNTDVKSNILDIGKFKKHFNWGCSTSLGNGIDATIKSVINRI